MHGISFNDLFMRNIKDLTEQEFDDFINEQGIKVDLDRIKEKALYKLKDDNRILS